MKKLFPIYKLDSILYKPYFIIFIYWFKSHEIHFRLPFS